MRRMMLKGKREGWKKQKKEKRGKEGHKKEKAEVVEGGEKKRGGKREEGPLKPERRFGSGLRFLQSD